MANQSVIAGIDIGSAKIATLIGQYNSEEERLNISGVGVSDSAGVRKGQIIAIDEAAGAIVESVEKAERMAGYNLDRALVSIGGGHIDSKNSGGVVAVGNPGGEITASDVARVVESAKAVSLPESRQILHVVPKEFKVDGETQIKNPEGMSGVRLEVETHLITGSTVAVKNIQKSVSEVGVEIDELVFSGLAAAYATLSDTEKELGVVLIDIGAGTTSIVVYVEGALASSVVLPIGAKNVTNDVAAGLRISLESAEKIKLALSERARGKSRKDKKEPGEDELDLKSLGIEDEEKTVSEKTLVEGIIKPRLNEIFTMVGMALTESGTAGKTPSGAVITGGGALCVGAVESAKRMLSMPARVGLPKGITGLTQEVGSPAFAASVGLLIYGIEEELAATPSAWSPGSIFSKIKGDLPVKGIIDRASELFKKILP